MGFLAFRGLKIRRGSASCGFDSRLRHHKINHLQDEDGEHDSSFFVTVTKT